jgi:4-aminobutyrate aminotransferase-like enzyme
VTPAEKYAKYVNTSFVKALEPITVASAHGSTVTAEDGRTYTDLFAGISVVNAGHGLMIGIKLVKDAKKTPAEEAGKVWSMMREKGFLIGVGGTWGNVLRWQPPLVIAPKALTAAVRALDEVLAAV